MGCHRPNYGQEEPAFSGFSSDVPGGVLNTDIREYLAQFNTATHFKGENTSLTRRPDAISFDYQTSFTLGPVEVADVSQGIAARVWKVRVDNELGEIYFARANDTNTAWEAEQLLFSFDTDFPCLEIDAAFEQAGRIVVVAERATGVGGSLESWIYWFDPAVPGFIFVPIGEGRSPRCLLDNPLDTTDSDVLVFLMRDAGLIMFQQRERYEDEHITPVVDGTNRYIEDVVRSTDGRVYVVMSHHNIPAGQYNLEILASTLYPKIISPDSLDFDLNFVSVDNPVIVIEDDEFDELEFDLEFISALNAADIIEEEIVPDEMDFDLDFISAINTDPIIDYAMPPEELEFDLELRSVTNPVVVIQYAMPAEELEFDLEFVSAENVVP